MAIDATNYFNKSEQVKRLIEEIKADKAARDNIRSQIQEMNVKVTSVTDDKRAVIYSNINNLTKSLTDLEFIISRKEKELSKLNRPDISLKTISIY